MAAARRARARAAEACCVSQELGLKVEDLGSRMI